MNTPNHHPETRVSARMHYATVLALVIANLSTFALAVLFSDGLGNQLGYFAQLKQFAQTQVNVVEAAGASHVRMDGSDTVCNGSANAAVASAPSCAFKTIQKAVNSLSAAGDRIIIHAGTYPEYVQIGPGQPNGTAQNPIIIEGDPAVSRSSIIVDGSAFDGTFLVNGTGGASTKAYYIFQHFSFNTGRTHGMELGTFVSGYAARMIARDLEVHSINFVQAVPYNSPVITASTWLSGPYGNNGNMLIEDVVIDNIANGNVVAPGVAIFLTSGNSIVRRVTVRDVRAFGRVGDSATIEYNNFTFSDCNSDEGCLQLYNGSGLLYRYNTMRVTGNMFTPNYPFIGTRELQNSANPFASAYIYNNVFKYEGTSQPAHAIKFDAGTQYASVKNNIFIGFANQATSGAVIMAVTNCANFEFKYNALYNSYPIRSGKTNCFTTPDATNLSNTSVIDFNQSTYVPNAASRLIDAGDPTLSIPVGGGSRTDIGAYEVGPGTTWPYDFQLRDSTISNQPTLDWNNGSSANINLDQPFGFSVQTGFQCQIDSIPTFDSQGRGVPLYDSGTPNASTATSCQSSTTLPNGNYYARMRFRNENPSIAGSNGIWSDHYLKFSVGSTGNPVCGNGAIESGEQCDGSNLGGASCTSNGFTGGVLSCSSSCQFITNACTSVTPTTNPVCGNSIVEVGEQCDGSNLGSATCVSQGFIGGTLTCSNSCQLNTAACSNSSTTPQGTTISISNAVDNQTSGPTGSGDATWNRGGYDTIAVGATVEGPQRTLIRFDLSSVPAGSTIVSATLKLTCTGAGSATTANSINAFPLLKSWSEGNSTSYALNTNSAWTYTNYPTAWTTAGAGSIGSDRGGTALGSQSVTGCSNTMYSWNLDPATISNWVGNPLQNYGMVLIGNEIAGTNKIFASSEHAVTANRPQLIIVYSGTGSTPPADTTAPTGVGNVSPVNAATGVSLAPILTAATAVDATTPVSYTFELYSGTACSGTPLQTRAYGTSVTWNPISLSAGATYAWRNRARDAATTPNVSVFGTCTTFTTSAPQDTAAPTGVGNSSPSNGATNVALTPTLTAMAASDQTNPVSYYFELYKSSSCSGATTQTRNYSTATTWIPTTLTAASTYAWRNRAQDAVAVPNVSVFGACSTFTTQAAVATAPIAPSNLSAVRISTSQINLAWNDNSSNETGFSIQRKTGVNGTYSQIATVGAGTRSFSNTGLPKGTIYYYRIRAFNAVGNSGYSNEVKMNTKYE